jgi:MoaA/NifB/PqqE/SkfB family radical SAM enzyme
MKALTLVRGGIGLLNSKLLGKKVPLIVGFALTNKCNLKCKYCNIPSIVSSELTTNEAKSVIDLLAWAGCIRIGFTGGEPLLRKDVGEIIDYCSKKGIETTLTTNGFFFKEKINQLSKLSLLIISLDGCEEVNDSIRGKGSFKRAKEALLLAKDNNMSVALSCVVSNSNYNKLDFLFNLARELQVKIHFQFVSEIPLTANEIKMHSLNSMQKKESIERILLEKKTNSFILNSKEGLKQMLSESISSRTCAAGRIFFRVSAEGNLYSCWRQKNNNFIGLKNISTDEFKKKLQKFEPPKCDYCQLADGIELALVYSMFPTTILNVFLRY